MRSVLTVTEVKQYLKRAIDRQRDILSAVPEDSLEEEAATAKLSTLQEVYRGLFGGEPYRGRKS